MKFVVGSLSFFDNILNLKVVEASSHFEAMKQVFLGNGFEIEEEEFEEGSEEEKATQLENFAFDCYLALSAIEI